MTPLFNYGIGFLFLLYVAWSAYTVILYMAWDEKNIPKKVEKRRYYIYYHGHWTVRVLTICFISGMVVIFVIWLLNNLNLRGY